MLIKPARYKSKAICYSRLSHTIKHFDRTLLDSSIQQSTLNRFFSNFHQQPPALNWSNPRLDSTSLATFETVILI